MSESQSALNTWIDEAANRFEAEWIAGERPRIEVYLQGVDADNRQKLLMELLRVEREFRHRGGESPEPKDYYTRFPNEIKSIDSTYTISLTNVPFTPIGAKSKLDGVDSNGFIGPYKVLEELGRGNFGVVYLATEKATNHKVAIKVIIRGIDTYEVIARFDAEKRAMGAMEHPNIIKLYSHGITHDRLPYVAMEPVIGPWITEYCERNRLPLRERLKLFVPVCDAVQHAHIKGVVHRDIKPGNVLAFTHDNKPTPKIIDFGVSKALHQADAERKFSTQPGVNVGTPAYMSPEQATSSPTDIDGSADIYALGVLLYELITDTTPYHMAILNGVTRYELLQLICNNDFEKPSRRLDRAVDSHLEALAGPTLSGRALKKAVRGDLDTIVMKATAKNRADRYRSASELGRDIERYLSGDPIMAVPPTLRYHLQKALAKHRRSLKVAFAFMLLSLAFGITTVQLIRRHAKTRSELHTVMQAEFQVRAKAAANEAEALRARRIAQSRMLAAASASERENRLDRSLLLAVEAVRAENTSEARDSLFKALHDRPGLEAFVHVDEGNVTDIAFSPDGKTLAALYGFQNHASVVLVDAHTRTRVFSGQLSDNAGYCYGIAFSPDGRLLAAAYSDRGSNGRFGPNRVVLWEVATRKLLPDGILQVKEGDVKRVVFSPDGKSLAAAYQLGTLQSAGGILLWDVATRKRLSANPLPVEEGNVTDVAFSPDGKIIAAGFTGHPHGGVVLWDVATFKRSAGGLLGLKRSGVGDVLFSPNGKTIVATLSFGIDGGGGVVRWDVGTRKLLSEALLPVDEGYLSGVAFSPDGTTLAAAYYTAVFAGKGRGGVVRWDTATGEQLADGILPVNEGNATDVAFSPDGKTIAVGWEIGRGIRGGGVMLWNSDAYLRQTEETLAFEHRFTNVVLSPDGKTMAAGYRTGSDGGVMLWNAATHERLGNSPILLNGCLVVDVAFSPDGRTVAVGYLDIGGNGGGILLLHPGETRNLTDEPLIVEAGNVKCVAFSPDGKRVAAGYSSEIVLWDVTTRQRLTGTPLVLREGGVTSLVFSDDGNTIAIGYDAGSEGGVVFWDIAARRRRQDAILCVKEGAVTDIALSPDRKTLAVAWERGRLNGGVVFADVATGRRSTLGALTISEGHPTNVVLSPDGKTIAVGYQIEEGGGLNHPGRGVVMLWDLATAERLLGSPLVSKESRIRDLVFSSDGKRIVASYEVNNFEGSIILWNLDLESWQREAGRIANRNLTSDEWNEYVGNASYRPTFPGLPIPSTVGPR